MTTLTVSVDATWRMTRFEFNTPAQAPGNIYGYSEVLLQEPDKPTKGAEFLKARGPTVLGPMIPPPKEGEKTTYGTMMGAVIARGISDVMNDTVDVNGKSVAFKDVLAACEAFFNKWRVEDEQKPPPEPMMMAQAPPPPPPEQEQAP